MGTLKDKFVARKDYDDFGPTWSGFNPRSDILPIFTYEDPKLPSLYTKYFIDSWNVLPLYGKVDTLGIPITPRRGLINYCSYSKDSISCSLIQPAVDFYISFRQQYKAYYESGAINRNSSFFKKDLPPIRAHINGDLEYFNKIKEIYNNFTSYQKINNKSNFSKLWQSNTSARIKNFTDFFNELENYLSFKNLYFTRAGYVESTDFSLMHSGLAVDIYDGDLSNDSVRNNFIDDVNFASFVELCARNNLKIDREIPWRVYIDIRTTPNPLNTNIEQTNFQTKIKQYLPYYKKLQDFFDFYYAKVIPYDEDSYVYFQEFIDVIDSFYESYIRSFSTFNYLYINQCGNADYKSVKRDKLPPLMTENYLRMYLRIRNLELKFIIEKQKLQEFTEQSIQIYKTLEKDIGEKKAVISSVKYYTDNVGTLAYRNPSIYELDEQQKMP